MATRPGHVLPQTLRNADSPCAHSYLIPVIDRTLAEYATFRERGVSDLRIFDAGCGNGALAGFLLERTLTVTGCDLSAERIALARASRPGGHFAIFSVYEDMVGKFGGDWDVVLSSEVIEHLYDPRKFVHNVMQLLKPGGLFIVTTPYHGYLKNLALALFGKMDEHFTVLWDGGHIKFWSRKTLKILLEEAGFIDFQFYGAGRWPWLWKSMIVSVRRPG